jgi:hypothetical protein
MAPFKNGHVLFVNGIIRGWARTHSIGYKEPKYKIMLTVLFNLQDHGLVGWVHDFNSSGNDLILRGGPVGG